jgi:23S rRNA G2069 N7-methylase RlmK/C1962 C5-methylase RlmI
MSEFKFYLEKPELIEKYKNVILEIQNSNYKYPHKDKFDTIILDPPYAYRKSMEMYNGHKASKFNQIKDLIPKILNKNGIVITFGYHSVSMGNSRGIP